MEEIAQGSGKELRLFHDFAHVGVVVALVPDRKFIEPLTKVAYESLPITIQWEFRAP
jgi:hypothetical protein